MAQSTLTFTQVDVSTYKAWEEARWRDLIDTSEIAIDQGIDYFYLRLRTGIAYQKLKRDRKAMIHFAKALEFNSGDPLAKQYYISACVNSGDFHTAAWADTSSGKRPHRIIAIIPELGQSSNDAYESLKTVYEKPNNRNMLMEKELSGPFQYASFTLIHELSPQWQIDQNISWLQMEKFQQVQYDKTTLLNPGHITLENSFTTQQFSWYINPKYYPSPNREVAFYLHSFLVVSNPVDYSIKDVILPPMPPVGSPTPSPVDFILSIDTAKHTDFEFSTGISFKKNHLYFTRDWQTNIYKGSNSIHLQTGLTYTIYPFAKPRFSMASSVYGNLGRESGFVFKQNFRYKPFSFFEVELYGLMGNMTYFTDNNGATIYNLPDPMRLKAGMNIMLTPFKKLVFFGGYTFSQSNTQVIWNDFAGKRNNGDLILNQSVNSYFYNNKLIFGGILWAF
ncbi:MAG: hypothetical protein CVU05_04785 [Bacteroidetes bacterium HGW-Bacteroidetes-21]|jgi:hypothetical protein|nr:MAG: hypothetical protein CVU05_04785 [Bacteroidetes bacterium HGW-Bacteroidetes-21]